MRKRIITILLALTMLVCVSLLPSAASTEPVSTVAANTVAEGTFHAGYSMIDITPATELVTAGLPMSGYGSTIARLSKGFVDANKDGDKTNDGLRATCVAVTDSKQNTVLMIGLDLIGAPDSWSIDARHAIVAAAAEAGVTVDFDSIYLSASHTHSGPDVGFDTGYSDATLEKLQTSDPELYATVMRARTYRLFLIEQLCDLAVAALNDRSEVTMTKGQIDASQTIASLDGISDTSDNAQMNSVRHYKIKTYQRKNYINIVSTTHVAGSNFGNLSLAVKYDKDVNGKEPGFLTTNIDNYYFVDPVSDADDMMYLVQLTPTDTTKEPIVLVNWRAHNTEDSTTMTKWGLDNYNNISPGYVGIFRSELDKAGYRSSFILGAAGNITPTTSVVSEKNANCLEDVVLSDGTTATKQATSYMYGMQLVRVAKQGLTKNMSGALDTSEIRVATAEFVSNYNYVQDVEAQLIQKMKTLTADDGSDLMTYLTFNDARWAEKSYYVDKYKNIDISYLNTIPSRYHLNGLRSRYNTTHKIPTATVGAISLGSQLSFVVAPFELSDRYSDTYQNFSQIESINNDNKWTELADSTYGTPLVMGYTNGSLGYLAHSLAYDYNNGLSGYVLGAYETSGTGFGKGTGEALIDLYDNMLDTVNNAAREQCECGGTAVGKYGHTCEIVTFLPWSDPDNLPTIGNYYLTTDVTTHEQHYVQQDLHIDLNGHNITHEVANWTETATAATQAQTRVFSVTRTGDVVVNFSITDSVGGGIITRDLSNWETQDQNIISNWGLILLVDNDYTGSGDTYWENPNPVSGSFTLYNGILDSTGHHCGSGSIISNGATKFPITIYGGELKGGISGNLANGASAGAIYSRSDLNMYGGKLTGAVVYNDGTKSGGIGMEDSGILTFSGDAQLYGNYRTSTSGVTVEHNTRIPQHRVRIVGKFTGKVSMTRVDTSLTTHANPADHSILMENNDSTNVDISEGTILVDNHPTMAGYLYSGKIFVGTFKDQCECGGKAVGKYGHTCETVRFFAWPGTTTFPAYGNWYLKDHVTVTAQRSVTGELRIDLNGKNYTHKVAANETGNTRVFMMTDSGAYLSITDSTDAPGIITRDLSLKTTAQQEAINNWGLVCYMGGAVKGLTLYDGILDTTDQYSGGGSIFSNASTNAPLTIYGGELRAGITKGSWGAIHASAPVNLFGGTITGGKIIGGGNAYGGGIRIGDGTYKLTISGNPVVTGNYRVATATASPTVSNIFVNADQFEIVGTFNGNIGLTVVTNNALGTPAKNKLVGSCNNATISGLITVDNYQQYTVTASGSNLVLTNTSAAQTDSGMNTYEYETLTQAFAEYPGNGAVIRLMQDSNETVTVTQNTYLDLNGFDVAGVQVNKDTKLYVFDSKTDDYTVEDGLGYGKLISIGGDGDVEALPAGTGITRDGYLMVTENDGTSFHCLNLNTVGLSVRASEAGVYYQSQFGGDEVIKRYIVAYGSALGAGKTPNFADKTFTRFEASSWQCGTDASGNSKNLSNGTILTGILQTKNTYSMNKRNGNTEIYSLAYVELADGTRITGPCVQYSLREIMEGAVGLTGLDANWDTLTENKQAPIIEMYNTFKNVLVNWNIPNIKATIAGESGEDAPYEDDGILKVLLIGHSLGIDSAYFFPEVYKEETGKDIVVGILYHSGCPLYNHVSYLTSNAKQYAYYEFDTSKDTLWRRAYSDGTFHTTQPGVANDTLIENGTIAVSMLYGIKRADWDIVVMQAGVWEVAGKGVNATNATITKNIQTIRNYVINQDIEKRSTPEFAWNITWAPPSKESGLLNASYTTSFTNYFNCDTDAMFTEIARVVNEAVTTAGTWKYIFPSGTAMHNAKTVMSDTALYRDTVHCSDYGRLMSAYVWLCRIENIDIDDCAITSISGAFRQKEADRGSDYTLTAAQKVTFKQIVGAALDNPYQITDCSK